MTELCPLGDRVLLKELDRADLTDQLGSLYLPRSYTDEKQQYMTGEVVNVGPLVEGLVPGMRVIHRQFRDIPLFHLRVCSVEDILGIITITVDDESWGFVPMGFRVAVRPEAPPRAGLLEIPEAWKTPSLRGVVMSVGPKVTLLTIGDEVLYPPSIGSVVEFAGEPLRIYQEDEILATMESTHE